MARRWAWAYVDLHRDDARRRHLKLRPRPQSLGAAVAGYLDHLERTAGSWRTPRNVRSALELHFVPVLGANQPWDTIDTARLQRLFDALADRGYARGTLETYRLSVSGLLTHLGAVPNPAAGVVLPESAKEDVYTWSVDDLVALRETADRVDADPTAARRDVRVLRRQWWEGGAWTAAGYPGQPPVAPKHAPLPSLRLALELGLGCGARLGELAVVGWPALRERDRTVRITHQLGRRRGELEPPKGDEPRTALVLPDWWQHHARAARGPVLGLPVSSSTIARMQHWLQLLYDLAGVNAPGRAWHTLRHTYARDFLELGGRLEELQKSLGHAKITTTETRYGHFHEDRAAALARLRIYGEIDERITARSAPARRARSGGLELVPGALGATSGSRSGTDPT